MSHHEHGEELMELSHEPVPGFDKALYICMAAGGLFLLLAFTGVF